MITGWIIILLPFYFFEERSKHNKYIGVIRYSYLVAIISRYVFVESRLYFYEFLIYIYAVTILIAFVVCFINYRAEDKSKMGVSKYIDALNQINYLERKNELTNSEIKRKEYYIKYISRYSKNYNSQNLNDINTNYIKNNN